VKIVLDASVVIAIVADDETNDYALAALEACAEREIVVPALWRREVANTFVVLEREGRLLDASAAFANAARNFPVRVAVDARIDDEIQIAKKHQLSVYDASYLALAIREKCVLATLDARLARAAAHEGAHFQPGALPNVYVA
jgi:predicted nucleic acid-binding protein